MTCLVFLRRNIHSFFHCTHHVLLTEDEEDDGGCGGGGDGGADEDAEGGGDEFSWPLLGLLLLFGLIQTLFILFLILKQ